MATVILNAEQHLYLQTIFNYFQDEGNWPTHQYLERLFIKQNPDLDIEELVKSLPPGLTSSVDLNTADSSNYTGRVATAAKLRA